LRSHHVEERRRFAIRDDQGGDREPENPHFVLLAERDPGLRSRLNAALLQKGIEVRQVRDEFSAHQALAFDGARISIALLGTGFNKGRTWRALKRQSNARIIFCGEAFDDTGNGICGKVVWPRAACPDLLADLVLAMIEGANREARWADGSQVALSHAADIGPSGDDRRLPQRDGSAPGRTVGRSCRRNAKSTAENISEV
jgi:hypothetical protein